VYKLVGVIVLDDLTQVTVVCSHVDGNRLCGEGSTIPSEIVGMQHSLDLDYLDNGNRIGYICPMTWACCSELLEVNAFCCITDKLRVDGHLDDEAMWKLCRNSC
jgi:hypothetical protein